MRGDSGANGQLDPSEQAAEVGPVPGQTESEARCLALVLLIPSGLPSPVGSDVEVALDYERLK
jgi:hypothetical protein